MPEPEEDDIAADIRAAMGTPDPEPASDPAPVEAEAAPVDEARARDEHGRFAPKEVLANAEQVEQPVVEPQVTEPPKETIQPPHSLKAPIKAAFATLAPEVQEEFRRIEDETQKAKQDWDAKAQRLNRFEASIPQDTRDRLTLSGVDEFTFMQRLIRADQMLTENPAQALAMIAQAYGLSLDQVGRQPQAQVDPTVAALQQQVKGLEDRLASQAKAEEETGITQAQQTVESFRKDHMYFDNVRAEMRALLESGSAKTLDEAYDMATYARPDIRKLLMADQKSPAPPTRPAGKQVNGSPALGAKPDAGTSTTSIEDDVRAAIMEVQGRL